jgi:membrane protease YdiL (CAAX protease family)
MEFIRFLINPSNFTFNYLHSSKERGLYLLKYSVWVILVIPPLLWGIVELLMAQGVIPQVQENSMQHGLTSIVSAIVVAPLLEEFLFRWPLRFYHKSVYFGWILYSVSALFAIVHLVNYEYDNSLKYLFWLHTSPQLFVGLYAAYIRLKLGIWYAVFIHAFNNVFAVLFLLYV